MKKLFGKTLAMAVMMSMFAGSAYADHAYVDSGMGLFIDGESLNDNGALLIKDALYFYPGGTPNFNARYGVDSLKIGDITLDTTNGLNMGGLAIKGVTDITATGNAEIGGNLTVKGTINASTSGAIASGNTGLVNGGAVYTYLESQNYLTAQDITDKADKATTLAGYGITDGATKSELDAKADKATTLAGYGITDGATKSELDAKADKATTLAGYGITDGATKTELNAKADKATTLAGYGITDGATKSELDAKADQTDLDTETQERKDADDKLQKQINDINSGSSAGLNELNNKINQTNDRVDRVGATAAALAGIHYQPMAKGQSQVAIGMGGYNGKKATAIGLAYQFDNRISGSVAGAANGSEHMFNVGFNYLFGQHTAKDIAPMAASNSVSLKEAELQAQVDSLNDKVARLEAMVKALAAK